jgi:hypothetical protein
MPLNSTDLKQILNKATLDQVQKRQQSSRGFLMPSNSTDLNQILK